MILVAVGGESDRQAALVWAADLALASQATLVVLHVRQRYFTRGVVWDEPTEADAAEVLNESTYELRRRNLAARRVVRLVPGGRLAEAIVRTAVEVRADLIVVGRSPDSGLSRFITANLSRRVGRLAPMPVLVVPRGQRDQPDSFFSFVMRPPISHSVI